MADTYSLPEYALSERFLAGTGPGGQNVNKVATACQLRIDVMALDLPDYALRRLVQLAGSRMTQKGELVILAQRYRTQEANRADARARAETMITAAFERQARRIPTRPSRPAKARRIEAKKARGTIKQGRRRVEDD